MYEYYEAIIVFGSNPQQLFSVGAGMFNMIAKLWFYGKLVTMVTF